MSTQQQTGERVQLAPFTTTEAHGIICAAIFTSFDNVLGGRHNKILVAALNGDFETALRLSVILLANYKIGKQGHDVIDVVDNLDEVIHNDKEGYRSMYDALFNKESSSEEYADECEEFRGPSMGH
jgi:hypothetical protein